MKKLVTLSVMLISVVLVSFNSVERSNSTKLVEGTWEYLAQDAPYEYQSGKFIFNKKDGVLKGHCLIRSNKIDFEKVKFLHD